MYINVLLVDCVSFLNNWYYEGAIIATVICLVTLISLTRISDFITMRKTKSFILVFHTPSFEMDHFLDFASAEGVEVRKLDIIDEGSDDDSIIESTLSFHRDYNIGSFFKRLKSDFHLKSVRLSHSEY